jgi:UDP-N-acetylmuramate--alanine ligase
VLDIYGASEPPIPGVTSERLVGRMHELGVNNAHYAPSEEQLLQELSLEAQPGDLIITIGAGSVWKIGEGFAKELGVRSEELEARSQKSGAIRQGL